MIRRVLRDMGVGFPDMGVMDSRVRLYLVRLLFVLPKSDVRGYNRGVSKKQPSICTKCGHAQRLHTAGHLGCHAAYTEPIEGSKLRRIVICGCKHSARMDKRRAA